MASAAHEEAGAANSGVAQKRNLQKAFKHLKSHASAIANFTLQWQDLEDYVRSVQLQIDSRLAQLQTQTPVIAEPLEQEQDVAAPEAEADGIPDRRGKEKAPSSSPIRGGSASTPSKDGKSLLLHLVERLKGRKVTRYEVRDAFPDFEICERVMLEAMKEYVDSRESRNDEVPLDLALARKICSVLLLEFMMGKPEIGEQVRENARRLAVEWKGKLETIEASLFIKYLQAYGLVGDVVKEDEIFKIFEGVLHRIDAPELLRSVRLGHKAADFVEKLIAQKKRIEAVSFIYAFELANQFAPISLIKEHLDSTKKDAAVIRRSGKTDEARVEAANLEFTALSAAMTCIKRHKLESQFPIEALAKRITQLKKQRSDSKKLVSTSQSNTQLQKHIGNKRQSPNTNKQMPNKRHLAAFPERASIGARPGLPYSGNPTQQVYVSHVTTARNAPHSATDSSSGRISVPPAYLQPPQPYLPQGVDISRATGGNGPSTSRSSMLSPTYLHQPPQLSTRGIHSSPMAAADAPTSVIELPPSIRDRFQSHTDLYPTQQNLSQYADASHRSLMDSLAASRRHYFMGSTRETESTTNLTPGQYRSTGSSLVPPYEISPTASYGVGGSRHFARDDLAGIRSDLAAISEMKYGVPGSSSYAYAGSSPPVSSTFSRSQHYLQTHDYPARVARPSPYSYNSLSSQGQGQPPRYTP